ncbi:hypothetical protein [Mesorhizobium sp. B2-8-9]|uniref:hypothetical protein n=1 Tax=Mesorhizobium sp. B2-8-9 TaxID=2589899 RepID=UPI001129C728|nr:hypothetical protein [Mesorhizobium sp. B2-8-9]TPI76276.1 hypothetical protein FJ423_21650 [Mesorhizobium sp. B2-8-9]
MGNTYVQLPPHLHSIKLPLINIFVPNEIIMRRSGSALPPAGSAVAAQVNTAVFETLTVRNEPAAALKKCVNAIALAPVEDFRRDPDLFGEGSRTPEGLSRFQAAFKRGFQTRGAEMDLAGLLGDLDGSDSATSANVEFTPEQPHQLQFERRSS